MWLSKYWLREFGQKTMSSFQSAFNVGDEREMVQIYCHFGIAFCFVKDVIALYFEKAGQIRKR
jgi:hypothetical protein